MKKIIIASILTLSSLNVFSQQKGSFELGLNVGYNAATVSNGSQTNSNYRSGVNFGISGDYFFNNRWSLKAKLIVDQKG
jgi:hypothetical protein